MKRIVQHQGIRGLYAGLQTALIANSVTQGAYYYFFQFFTNTHGVTYNSHALWQILVGFEAGCASVLVTNPFWVVNAKQITMQKLLRRQSSLNNFNLNDTSTTATANNNNNNNNKLNSTISGSKDNTTSYRAVFRRILLEEGMSGLYSGLLPALLLSMNPAAQFYMFELMKRFLIQLKQHGGLFKYLLLWFHWLKRGETHSPSIEQSKFNYGIRLGVLEIFVLGALAKMCSTMLTFPIQSVKTNMQRANSFASVSDCLVSMYKQGGLFMFYTGLHSKLVQTGLTSAFMFLFHDRITRHISTLLSEPIAQ